MIGAKTTVTCMILLRSLHYRQNLFPSSLKNTRIKSTQIAQELMKSVEATASADCH